VNKGVTNRVSLALVILVMLTFSLVNAPPAFTQAQISHHYTFGQSVIFNLSLGNTDEFTDYTLFISTPGMSVTSHTISPENGGLSFERNLRDFPLPPFSQITYWWEYKNHDLELLETEKHTFQYIDNRFAWESYSDNDVTVHWINIEKSIMVNAVPIIKEAIETIQHALQTTVTPVMNVYFYPSAQDLKSALQLAGYEWVAGAAYPELGVILLSVTDGPQAISQMQRTLPHEVTHKMLYDIYGQQGYQNIPAWLVEGLASYFEPTPDPAYAVVLEDALATRQVLTFGTLCYPFPDEQSIAFLAYAQSENITRFIQQTYGWSHIRSLLERYAVEGISCTTAIEEEFDLQITQFEREWKMWRQSQGNAGVHTNGNGLFQLSPEFILALKLFVRDTARWLFLCAVLFAPFLFFGIQSIVKKRINKPQ
jgi:hypothetical protein